MPVCITRRKFIGGAASAVVSVANARTDAAPKKFSLLDIHQHVLFSKRPEDKLVLHQQVLDVATTVLLPGDGWMHVQLAGNEECWSHLQAHPDGYVTFCNVDPKREDAQQVLQTHLERGALGIGEQKFKIPADSPEMRRVYDVAREFDVPVLLHFGREYNTGLERFHKILEAYPQVNFIGHATGWWANISAVGASGGYPNGPVKPGGISDRLLSDYANMYGDLSANSGRNALSRDPDFASDFVLRLSKKLIWGSDCPCHDGQGGAYPKGYCIAQRSLARLKEYVADPRILLGITYDNGARLLKLGIPL